MTDWIKGCWAKRPRLSRGWKLARNLVLTAVLLVVLWFSNRSPALTREGALRKLERELLLSPGQTLYAELGDQREEKQVFVLGEGYAYTGTTVGSGLDYFAYLYDGVRLDRDPALLLLPNGQGEQAGQYQLATLYCSRGPEGAVRVSLPLTCRYDMVVRALDDGRLGETLDAKTDTLTFEAEQKADDWGVYPLALGAEDTETATVLYELLEGWGYETDEDGSWERNCSIDKAEYQMKFYQADGSLLLEHRGTIPT